MPGQIVVSPIVVVKFILWILVVAGATLLLRRRKVTPRVRLIFLVGGTLVFGFLFGLLIPGGMNPNPVASLRTLLTSILVKHRLVAPVALMLGILLVAVWVSNKSICGWACQLGLLQDLIFRVKVPKWKPPFWLSNGVRIVAFVALLVGLLTAGLDWIGAVDPFQIFSLSFALGVVLLSGAVLVASLFVYRPWCCFLCPFGLVGWVVEQVSLLRPRVNRDACKKCQLCVRACPSRAMADFYAGNAIHADCFACGACIDACPQSEALGWWTRSESGEK